MSANVHLKMLNNGNMLLCGAATNLHNSLLVVGMGIELIVLVLWSKMKQCVTERVSLFIFYNACIDGWILTENCV